MCLRPINITVKSAIRTSDDIALRMSRRILVNTDSGPRLLRDDPTRERYGYLVPCGHCVECMANKQKGVAYRCYRECLRVSGKVVFATFTFRPESLPFATVPVVFDEDTGECYTEHRVSLLSGSRLDSVRADYLDYFGRNTCFPVIIDDDSNCYAPTLDTRAWRLWLKAARVSHGLENDGFKYWCTGEYGPNTGRPHFHCLFFGLDLDTVRSMCSTWERDYGHVDVRKVELSPKAAARAKAKGRIYDPFEAVSRYVGKYVSKGVFEHPNASRGLIFRPRMASSIGFGLGSAEDFSKLREWLTDGITVSPTKLPTTDPVKLAEIGSKLASRRTIKTSSGNSFKVPSYLLEKVFYYKRDDKKLSPSPISSIVSDCVRNKFLADRERALAEATKGISDPALLAKAVSRFYACLNRSAETRRLEYINSHKQTFAESLY